MRFSRLVLVVLVFVLGTVACHSARPPVSLPPVTPIPDASFAFAKHVDPKQPETRMLVTPAVAAVSVPVSAVHGRSVTTVFRARGAASCDADVAYAGSDRHQRLGPAVADTQGFVRWTWTPVAAGQATATVICSGGQRGEVSIPVT